MTRNDYLAQLDKYLRRLPADDYQEAMEYFVEYFDEAGPEQEEAVMAELGSPKEAASDIINNILDRKIAKPKKTSRDRWKIVWITILAILAIPVGIPLFIALCASILGLLATIISIWLAALSLSLTCFILGFVTIWEAFTLLSTAHWSVVTLGFGGGLAGLGAGLLLLLLLIFFIKQAFRFIRFLIKKLSKGGKAS